MAKRYAAKTLRITMSVYYDLDLTTRSDQEFTIHIFVLLYSTLL